MNSQATEIVDDRSFSARVLEPRHAMLVLFTARGCLPCDFLARGLPAVASDLHGAIGIVSCATEASPRTVQRYSVGRTPTLLLFMGGGLIASRVGPAPLPAIRRWVMDALKSHMELATQQDAPISEGLRRMRAARVFFRHVVSRAVAVRACGVASLVAPVLLLLNHADLVLRGPLSSPVLRKLALDFVVPYLVSSYSSAWAATRGAATDPEATS